MVSYIYRFYKTMTKVELCLLIQLVDAVFMGRKTNFLSKNYCLRVWKTSYIVKKDASSFSSRTFPLRFLKTMCM